MSTCIAAKVHLTMHEGGTFDRDFKWYSGEPSLPVNLTGCQGYGSIRLTTPSITTLLALPTQAGPWGPDSATGIYITDPEDGSFKIYIKDENSFLCASHVDIKAVYDVFINSSSDEVIFKLYGNILIKAAVTRS